MTRLLSHDGGRIQPANKGIPLRVHPPRPRVHGKFIYLGKEKLYVRGVTYGTFRPDDAGCGYHDRIATARDFAMMSANGVNAVRTYTPPPVWFLDLAMEHGLFVMVGLCWEQHISFLDEPERVKSIENRVRDAVRSCAGHPAILCYSIGNEIPSPIVRWHGAKRTERFLRRLYDIVKQEDPDGLVTYVNFPSTEYLDIDFVDFYCFNVYLETRDRLEAYLARLQNIAGDRPLVMAEIGLDSLRNGVQKQAEVLDWQIRTTFAAGCAGAFIFAWTDEWNRGGADIDDWDFGITTRDRQPKPALAAVSKAFSETPFPHESEWPSISVVVCSRNGAMTIRDCMEGLLVLEYPNYEVIVVDDGSTDRTAAIAREYPYRLISTENRGLSSARNTGMMEARGEIIAYIDDDAYPDPHWLQYLAMTYRSGDYVAVGGPNIAPPGDGRIADCVANAPGGPVHVLLSDREAEHIPGCNMSVRRDALMAIGGFDPRYRAAGDDVDVCWRLMERGGTIGFSPAAVVWHHRRNSLRTYWRQQKGYGKAEALLEEKWPEKYNVAGHLTWCGRLYGNGLTEAIGFKRGRIYQGTWGSAPFQSIYEPAAGGLSSLLLMPEWYLVILALSILSTLGLFWTPLLLALPLALLAIGAILVQGVRSAFNASFTSPITRRGDLLRLRALTAALHIVQPFARLCGRIAHGLTVWRRRGLNELTFPLDYRLSLWSESWEDPIVRMTRIEKGLKDDGGVVLRGGDFDRWDLDLRGGMFGRARTRMVFEEHGGGRQMLRFLVWPGVTRGGGIFVLAIAALAACAGIDGAPIVTEALVAMTVILIAILAHESASALGTLLRAIERCAVVEQVAEAAVEEHAAEEHAAEEHAAEEHVAEEHAVAEKAQIEHLAPSVRKKLIDSRLMLDAHLSSHERTKYVRRALQHAMPFALKAQPERNGRG